MGNLKILALLFFTISLSSFALAKNIIYFIGDGLGTSQRQISEYYKQEILNNPEKLAMNSFPIAGITTTHSLNSFITDSAAAGTALATGYKTNNGVISQTPDGKKLKTLLELAQEKNMKTGLITSTRITHATPAVFASHNSSRKNEDQIAENYINSSVDLFLGGGYSYFVPKTGNLKSRRKDEKNLISEFNAKGYKTFIGEKSSQEFLTYKFTGKEKIFAAFTDSHLPYEIDRVKENSTPSLAELTEKGIAHLSTNNENGFFLMVEGGRIDHASHAQDVVGTINDTLVFDLAIKKALDFYKENPEDTLIVIASDHETGGMGLGFSNDYFLTLSALKDINTSVEDILQKKYNGNNEEYFAYLEKEVGLKNLTPKEKIRIEKAMKIEKEKIEEEFLTYGNYAPTSIAVAHIISERAGVQWTTFAHTATQVPLSAIGNSSELFSGFYDNTDVAKKIATAMGGKL